jgi:hypothetical protein
LAPTGPVFLHINDIVNWSADMQLLSGMSVNFTLESDGYRNFKALDAKLYL